MHGSATARATCSVSAKSSPRPRTRHARPPPGQCRGGHLLGVAAAIAADDGAEAPDDGTVTVIVAANAQVTNTQTRQQEQRSYRFSVKIKEVDGTPKVSDVEFVP
ncbi:hypothetical protein AB0E01_27410 [Nocardia vinacea]|uniref:hypothetical protein n=1 Tax=Nocardia vinacea TaxID=96468 RepID=UPI0033DBA7AD